MPGAVLAGHRLAEPAGEVGDERVRVDGGAGAVVDLLDRDQPAGLPVDDDLGDAAGGRRDDGQLAGHRLEVDDAQRLVDRRANEDPVRRTAARRPRCGATSPDPDDAVAALGLEVAHQRFDLGHDLLGVRRARAQDELHVRRQRGCGAQQIGQPLLPGDPADEDDGRLVGVHAVLADDVLVGPTLPQLSRSRCAPPQLGRGRGGYALRMSARIPALTAMTAAAPRRTRVPRTTRCGTAAELLGLPGPERPRLCAVTTCGIPPQHRRQVTGRSSHTTCASARGPRPRSRPRWPGRPPASAGPRWRSQARTDRRSGRAGLLTRRPEAADLDVDVAAFPQGADQLGDVHTGSSVDRGRYSLLRMSTCTVATLLG